jgi:DNA-binding XRE family transcriptional regulator
MPGPANARTATAGRRSPGLPAPRAGLAGPAGPDAPGDAETLARMRRALGQQLAAMRNRAGLSQWQLAPMTGYSRSTLSDAELGRHRFRREFWLRCDELLKADSRLVASYEQIEAAAAIMRQRARGAAELARDQDAPARLQGVRPALAPVPADHTRREPAGSLAAMEACPHCRRPIAVLVVPAAAGPGRRTQGTTHPDERPLGLTGACG